MITPLLTDFYKIGHPFQYPEGTEIVYSNFTPRKSRLPGVDRMVFFGLQHFIQKYMVEHMEENFFGQTRTSVLHDYRRIIRHTIGDLPSYDHIERLHALGYLPLSIRALSEGSAVPMRTPCFTICNTHPDFYWLPNFWETQASASIWQACTSATLAWEFRKMLDVDARETGMDPGFVKFQGHDFSYRGMSSLETAISSGMGHLLSFVGTDTIPAVVELERYYGADVEHELVGCSVPATEHSVMCAGGEDNELDTYRRLVTKVYPKGIVSIVSDTWDLWKVLTEVLPALKAEIMARDGKVVIRPDSGDPADILCGTGGDGPAGKGVVELLWEVFGGTETSAGYRLLDPHIGAIYGDSINRAKGREINTRLAAKGFASQVVFGIGSYTYQYNTRDTFGTAIKATWVRQWGNGRPIFKAPKTDDGTKNSARGLLSVLPGYKLLEGSANHPENLLRSVFEDGVVGCFQNLREIRQRLQDEH